jgi:hypothetical protein
MEMAVGKSWEMGEKLGEKMALFSNKRNAAKSKS